MTIQATAVWEVRTTGASGNGAGYDSGIAGAGTDYSQQDAAQLSLTDLAMTTGGTTLTSATGGFTSAMVGNAIQISAGTNFTTGWYFITAFTDTNTVTIDRDATTGVDGSGGTGAVGGAMDIVTDAFAESFVAGNECHVEAGTYTYTASVSMSQGFQTSGHIAIKGYNTTRNDDPKGDNRPLFAMGANIFQHGSNIRFEAIRGTGTGTTIFAMGNGANPGTFHNIKAENTSGTSNRSAIEVGGGMSTDLEGVATNGFAIKAKATESMIVNAYAHDSVTGIFMDRQGACVTNSIAYNCTTGFRATQRNSFSFCTSEDNNTGFDMDSGGAYGSTIYACVVDGATLGIDGEPNNYNYEDWTLFGTNTTDTADIFNGANSITGTTNFNNSAGEDFTYTSGSDALSGFSPGSNIGLTGDYEWNLGYAQNAIGGGGGEVSSAYIS